MTPYEFRQWAKELPPGFKHIVEDVSRPILGDYAMKIDTASPEVLKRIAKLIENKIREQVIGYEDRIVRNSKPGDPLFDQDEYEGYYKDQQPQTKKAKKAMTIRKNHVISLLQKDFTTIGVVFNDNQRFQHNYTYKARLSDDIKDGQHVIVKVDGKDGYHVALVVRVDAEPQIDTDATFDYKWIVGKVDTAAYDEQVAKEEAFAKELTRIERDDERKKVLEKFTAAMPAGTDLQLTYDKVTLPKAGE